MVIGGFSMSELGSEAEQQLWLRDGLPLSYLSGSNINSIEWRKNFIQPPLERDFPQWGVRVAATALQRFWTMVAHYHGQVWNSAEPARALGASESTTIRINDDLLKRAKKHAADQGRTLTSLVEDGLALVLSKPKTSRKKRVELPVSKVSGGVLPGVGLNRSSDLLDTHLQK